jgi:hypothetical protein
MFMRSSFKKFTITRLRVFTFRSDDRERQATLKKTSLSCYYNFDENA